MNYLAHAWLAGPDPEWIVGAFLGDHVRGRDWAGFPDPIARSILQHRRIDAFVDEHRIFKDHRQRFDPPFRRYAGILLDLAYDHLLARRWATYEDLPLEEFSARCHQALDAHWRSLPASLRRFLGYAKDAGIPAAYRSADVMRRVLAGIAGRLSRGNPLAHSWPVVVAQLDAIETDFDALLTDLRTHAEQQRARLEREPLSRSGGAA